MAPGLTRTEQYALIGVVTLMTVGVMIHVWREQNPPEVAVNAGQGRWEKIGEISADGRTTFTTEAIEAPSRSIVIDINKAGAAELDRLPGIGPAKAQAILDARERLGGFKTIEQLDEAKGIGPATVEKLRPYIKLEATSQTVPAAMPDDTTRHQPTGLIE